MRYIKIPGDIADGPAGKQLVSLEKVSVVQSCTQLRESWLGMYAEEHLLFFVLEGEFHARAAGRTFVTRRKEFISLQKHQFFECRKLADHLTSGFSGILFCLKEEIIITFLHETGLYLANQSFPLPSVAMTSPFGETIAGYLATLMPLLREHQPLAPNLLRLKILEMLYHLHGLHGNIVATMVPGGQITPPFMADIVEQHYLRKISLLQLARLCGRSLSSFRRDFLKQYQVQPARWIQQRRLAKARQLLRETAIPVGDVYRAVGFEGFSHFSRAYKAYYGFPPSAERAKDKLNVRVK